MERLPRDVVSSIMNRSDFPDAASLALAMRRRGSRAAFDSVVATDLRPRANAYTGRNIRDTSLVRGHFPAGSIVDSHDAVRSRARSTREAFEESLKYVRDAPRTTLLPPRRLRRNGYRLASDLLYAGQGPDGGRYFRFELVETERGPGIRFTFQTRHYMPLHSREFWIPQSDMRRIEGDVTTREKDAFANNTRLQRYLARYFSGTVSL